MSDLKAALEAAIHEHGDHDAMDRGLVTDYVMVIEQLGDDGKPYLRCLARPGTPAWRTLGLLDAALTQRRYDFTDEEPT